MMGIGMMVNSPYIILLTLKIFNSNDVVLARQRARQITALLNFDLHSQTKIATVVSEIARNAYQYAGGGKIEYCLSKDLSKPKFIVRISDKGPGISNLTKILAGQNISTTGSGVGIIGSKRIMDELTINTSSQHGTEVIAEMNLPVTASILKP
jgi:anti-sigma regulatory factor (Ser/Thr protein kinase)